MQFHTKKLLQQGGRRSGSSCAGQLLLDGAMAINWQE